MLGFAPLSVELDPATGTLYAIGRFHGAKHVVELADYRAAPAADGRLIALAPRDASATTLKCARAPPRPPCVPRPPPSRSPPPTSRLVHRSWYLRAPDDHATTREWLRLLESATGGGVARGFAGEQGRAAAGELL
jgi:hypothetical protein